VNHVDEGSKSYVQEYESDYQGEYHSDYQRDYLLLSVEIELGLINSESHKKWSVDINGERKKAILSNSCATINIQGVVCSQNTLPHLTFTSLPR